MEKKYYGILCAMLLSACGNYVTREELQRSQAELRSQVSQEDLAVHTCAQTLGAVQMFDMVCQNFGSLPHCAAVQSWVESCQSEDSDGLLRLPDPGVWERLLAAADEAAASVEQSDTDHDQTATDTSDTETQEEASEQQETFVPLDNPTSTGRLQSYSTQTEADPD